MSELGMLKSSDGAEPSVDFSSAIELIQRLLISRFGVRVLKGSPTISKSISSSTFGIGLSFRESGLRLVNENQS